MPSAQRERLPNILFVFADQMRGQDLHCAGNPALITPHLDRLARTGVLASRHYANCPLCGPNRATMLTGTYATTHRLLFNDTQVRTDLPSLGSLAKAQGYRVGYVGKWHLDGGPREAFIPPGPRRLGFTDFWAAMNCTHSYFRARFYRDDSPALVEVPGYEPAVQTDLALEFLAGQARDPRPFCLVVSWGPPHNPYEEVPPHCQALYPPGSVPRRPNWRPIPRECLDPVWTEEQTPRDYAALITSLDEQFGRLFEALDQYGLADDTIVVFTSDHGDMMWSQGLLYKCVPFEESIGVPLLIRAPRSLPADRRCDALIASVDLVPTLAGLAGWPASPGLEGRDLSGVLAGTAAADDAPGLLLAQYNPYVFRQDFPVPEWRGLRTARYTYAATVDRRPWLVFDNEADPYQLHNLATEPSAQPLRAELAARLEQRLQDVGDPFLPAPQMAARFRADCTWNLY